MCKLAKFTLILSVSGLIATCPLVYAEDEKTVLALVNGTELTVGNIGELPGIDAEVDFTTLDADRKAQILIGLINRQLIFEQATKEGFDKSEPIVNAINDMAQTFIVKQYLVKVAAGTDLSEEVLTAYYEDNFSDLPEQYEISHILLSSEGEANSVLALLKEGAQFPDLAKTKSKDQVSAEKGGDLGWLTSADMLPAFYRTVSGLDRGNISAQPTRTQFGWHIVKLNDKREATPQAFDQVKPVIQQTLIQKEMTAYLENLRDNATIEIK